MEETIGGLSGGNGFTFQKPILLNSIPPGRGGCSAVYADGKIVVFGGHFFEGNDTFKYLNEVWLLDVEKLLWHRVTCTGEIPAPRYGHCAHILGSRMFIFGGKGANGAVYKDVYYLDLLEWIWVPVSTITGTPSPRFFFASEVVGRKIVIHGGWDGDNVLDDLWIFNTESFMWMQPRTAGHAPSPPRYGHTLTLTPDGRLLIFGGTSIDSETSIPRYHNDLRQLDTNTMVWSRPSTNGLVPSGRQGHSLILLANGMAVLFGGWGKSGLQSRDAVSDTSAHSVMLLDTKTMTWYVPKKRSHSSNNDGRGNVVAVRHLYQHAVCRAGPNTVYLFGGFDGRQAIGEFYTLDIDQP